jgi:hypothetical protein
MANAPHSLTVNAMFASIDTRSTGLPVFDAQADFRRARRAHAFARVGRLLRRGQRSTAPATLPDGPAPNGGPTRLQVVPLQSIVGTVEPSAQFDSRFRPASESVRRRWERIALAHRRGEALPPITLREGPGGYYVLDGRHRTSVAQALGLRDIDAWVAGRPQRLDSCAQT